MHPLARRLRTERRPKPFIWLIQAPWFAGVSRLRGPQLRRSLEKQQQTRPGTGSAIAAPRLAGRRTRRGDELSLAAKRGLEPSSRTWETEVALGEAQVRVAEEQGLGLGSTATETWSTR